MNCRDGFQDCNDFEISGKPVSWQTRSWCDSTLEERGELKCANGANLQVSKTRENGRLVDIAEELEEF